MQSLKDVLQNPPMRVTPVSAPLTTPPTTIDYAAWCRQVLEVVGRGVPCAVCSHATERTEIDSLYIGDTGPLCMPCYSKFGGDHGV